jgi:hypothetical protein
MATAESATKKRRGAAPAARRARRSTHSVSVLDANEP